MLQIPLLSGKYPVPLVPILLFLLLWQHLDLIIDYVSQSISACDLSTYAIIHTLVFVFQSWNRRASQIRTTVCLHRLLYRFYSILVASPFYCLSAVLFCCARTSMT